ncbi:hypothetical protein EV714DRAFT_244975, partial [Schizophyllum commune]
MLLKFSTIISVFSLLPPLLLPPLSSFVSSTTALTAPIHHDLLLSVCSLSRAPYLRSTARYPLSIHSDLDLSYRVLELLMREERHGINFGRSTSPLGCGLTRCHTCSPYVLPLSSLPCVTSCISSHLRAEVNRSRSVVQSCIVMHCGLMRVLFSAPNEQLLPDMEGLQYVCGSPRS